MRQIVMLVVCASVCVALCSAEAGDWRFPVRLTYPSGAQDVIDTYEEFGNADASTMSGAGISFAPHFQFDHGSRIGGIIGPIFIIAGDLEHYDVPLGVVYGFTILPSKSVSPYFHAGVIHHVAGGDYYDESTPGLVVAFGMEFNRDAPVAFGFEIGYDSSEMTLVDDDWWGAGVEEVKPGEVLVSIFAVF